MHRAPEILDASRLYALRGDAETSTQSIDLSKQPSFEAGMVLLELVCMPPACNGAYRVRLVVCQVLVMVNFSLGNTCVDGFKSVTVDSGLKVNLTCRR